MQEMINAFVGRSKELAQWDALLREEGTSGKAVVVVGKYGMGKTWLLDRMVQNALDAEELCCVTLRYTVASDESPGMVMKMMLEDAFQAARYEAGSLAFEGKRFAQWNRFYRRLGLFDHPDEQDYSLLQSLRYDPEKNILGQFIGRLKSLADILPENGRLLVVVDPEADTPAMQVERWSEIVRSLPPKVLFLFAQRFKDTLAVNDEFRALENVRFIPPENLGDLSGNETAALADAYRPALEGRVARFEDLAELFQDYGNHPYAVHAALNLLLCKGVTLTTLPRHPMPGYIAPLQWEQIVRHPLGPAVAVLFESYAILDVPALDEMACWVADTTPEFLQEVLADPFLRSLLRDEPEGRTLYHHHLAAYIRSLLYTPDGDLTMEAERLHQRAMIGYGDLVRRALKPDPLATVRFPEHCLAVGGGELFAEALSRCADAFLTLGFFQSFASKIERALALVPPRSVEAADLHFLLGRLRFHQHDDATARRCFEESLQIARDRTEPERAAEALYALGKLELERNNDEQAEVLLREAVTAFDDGLNHPSLAEALVLLANLLWRRGDAEESEKALECAVEAAKRIRNFRRQSRAMAGVFIAWGKMFEGIGDISHATELFHKAIDLTKDVYDLEAEAEIRATMGLMLQRSGDLKNAEENLARAMEIHEDLKLIEHWAEDCFQLALLAKKQGDRRMTDQRLELAKKLYRQLGNVTKLAEIDAEVATE